MQNKLNTDEYRDVARKFFNSYFPGKNSRFRGEMLDFIEVFLNKISPNVIELQPDDDPVLILMKWVIRKKLTREEDHLIVIELAKKYKLISDAVIDHMENLTSRNIKIHKNRTIIDTTKASEISLPSYLVEFWAYTRKTPTPKTPGPNPFVNTVRDSVIFLCIHLLDKVNCKRTGSPGYGAHIDSACDLVACAWQEVEPNKKGVPYENVRKIWLKCNRKFNEAFKKEFFELFLDLEIETFFIFLKIIENSLNIFIEKEKKFLFKKKKLKKGKN